MALDKFVFGILVFSVLMVTGIFVLAGVEDSYSDFGVNIDVDQYNSGDYDVSDSLSVNSSGDSRSMVDLIFGSDVEEDTSENSLFRGAFSALRVLKNTIGLMGSIINSAAVTIGVPGFLVSFGLIAITLFVGFGLVFMMFRFRG